MNRKHSLLLILAIAALSIAAPHAARAQWTLLDTRADSMVRVGLDATYNLRYAEADTIFRRMTVLYPDHPAGYFLLALVDWWRIVPNVDAEARANKLSRIFDERRFSKSFTERINRTIEICDQRLEKNPGDIVGLFFKGSALGYRARLITTRDMNATAVLDVVPAIKDGYEAYKTILQCQQLAPSNSDVLLGSGLYNWWSAYIRENYPMIYSAAGFLPPGDRKLGIQMLRISASRATYAGVEAQYTLVELLTSFEKDYSGALDIARALHQKYPSNPVFYKYFAKNLYMTSDFISADSAWSDILRRVKQRDAGYELPLARQGLYYLGDIRMRAGRYEDATVLFKNAIEQSERLGDDESSWIVQANLKLGNVYDLMRKRDDAVRQYKKVISMDEYSNSHQKAKEYLTKPYQ